MSADGEVRGDERPPAEDAPDAAACTPSPHVQIKTIEAVVNAASGSVAAGSGAALEAIVARFGHQVRVQEVQPAGIEAAVRSAVSAAPDLVVVLAGDGTARLAADLCGADGPLVAPLPGGTMNMLPKALYGDRDWQTALIDSLTHGESRCVSGGEVAGRSFYVAAILGSPALFADAREAVREMKLWLAMLRARRACMRAFHGPLRFEIDGVLAQKSEALTLMCPLISRALDSEDALEVAALDPRSLGEAARLGLRAAFGGVLGDWRKDPAVTVHLAREGRAWARGRIPAILDGEPHRLQPMARFRFKPDAFKALAPPAVVPAESEEEVIRDSVRAAI